MRVFIVSLLLATAAAAQSRIAVLPVQPRPGALTAPDAIAFTEEIRVVARDALASQGYEVIAAEGMHAKGLASRRIPA